MLLGLLRILLAGAFLILIPGYLLLNAALPRSSERMTWIERAYLSFACGALLLMFIGVLLGSLPHGARGFFSSSATGAPWLETLLALGSLGLFTIGLRRGAYPAIAARFPALATRASAARAESSR